jgi:hypothetical protein
MRRLILTLIGLLALLLASGYGVSAASVHGKGLGAQSHNTQSGNGKKGATTNSKVGQNAGKKGSSDGGGPTRYVSTAGSDLANNCSTKAHPCRTIEHAVTVASPGNTVSIDEGTYIEQVTVSESLTLRGAGIDSTVIQAPATKIRDLHDDTYVVEVLGKTTKVDISRLTVSGPGAPGGGNNCAPNALSLDKGIVVEQSATLDLANAAVRNIFDQPQSGCQRGDGISIGSPCFTCAADVGHASLNNVVIDDFQKNGIAVRGAGSTLDLRNSTIENLAQPQIASNGVEVLNGAVGHISHDVVIGNECNLPTVCGPNVLTDTQSSGILIIAPGAGTAVTNNTVSTNDLGIYTDTGIELSNNDTSANRDAGIFVDTKASGAHVTHNISSGNQDARSAGGGYGIYVNGAKGNTFAFDTAFGNQIVDLFTSSPTNTFKNNRCGTADPSRSTWDCH